MESGLFAGIDTAGVQLIETMLWDGQNLVRLPLHLARLQGSARQLGWRCDAGAADAALRAACPAGAARLRLTLDADGTVQVVAAALPTAKALWRLGLSSLRLTSSDPWLRVKSTRREAYETARAALPDGLDELVLCNERDEVCDGTITTVFFDRGQGMRTPPLTSGLLPGVLRASLSVPQEILLAKDLAHVRLWVGNSLRGLMPAVFAG